MRKTFKPFLEKRWNTLASLEAAVVLHPHGHRCGYVKVPNSSGLFNVDYNEICQHINVHGGLTFSGILDFIDSNSYWFGYDCAHSFDKTFLNPQGVERTLDYCIKECESLANQLLDNSPMSLFYLAKNHGTISEEQHRAMLAFGIEDPNNLFVKNYFKLIRGEEIEDEQ